MATTLDTTIVASLQTNFSNASDLQATAQNATTKFTDKLANGTAVDQADITFLDSETIAASGTKDYDLAASLIDVFGNTITFARIKYIFIQHLATSLASSIDIGGGSNPFVNWIDTAAAKVRVPKNGIFLLGTADATGYVVTAATGDILTITNVDGANAATIQTVLIGASA